MEEVGVWDHELRKGLVGNGSWEMGEGGMALIADGSGKGW